MKEAHGVLPCLRVRHIANEFVTLQKSRQGLQAWNLEVQGCGPETVRPRWVRGHGVGNDVAAKDISVNTELS